MLYVEICNAVRSGMRMIGRHDPMTTLVKKLFSAMLVLAMVMMLTPSALAEGTFLQMSLTGMYYTSAGTYQEVPLSGAFDVFQDEHKIGTINVTPEGDNTIALPGGGNVRIAPVEGAIPKELPVNTYGYSVAIAEGRMNIAPLVLYAQAGLFIVDAKAMAEFALIDEAGETYMIFQTNDRGYYAQDIAIPAGQYTLRMIASEGEIWPEQTVEILPWAGEHTILTVYEGEANATIVSYVTPQPPMAPAVTAEPAETSTTTPEPTQAPTATPVPTAAPTEVPSTGMLILAAVGDENLTVDCTITAEDGTVVAFAALSREETVVLTDLEQGEYGVTLQLPEDVVLTSLNGHETLQRETAQWKATVQAMKESGYEVELSDTGSLIVPFVDVVDAKVQIIGERESCVILPDAAGLYEKSGLLPDAYEITVQLPAGRYEAAKEHWTQIENADGTVTLTMHAGVNRDTSTELPLIRRIVIGSVSGKVVDIDGDALKNVQVIVYDAQGQSVAQAVTDKQGHWAIPELRYGQYLVQYTDENRAIPAGSFTLSDEDVEVELKAAAAKPAKLSVRVFVDKNNNGTNGKGEGFVRDVALSLLSEDGTLIATGLTNKDGYVTLNAPEGKYFLQATAPEDYCFGKKGSELRYTHSILDEGAEITQNSELLTLIAGETLEVGVGLQEAAAVTGTVWNDLNADGKWQKDEPGIPDVRVTIEGTRNGLFYETVTDENGWYELRQIRSGAYKLTCHVPEEYVFTVKAKGDVEEISRMTTEADRAGEDKFSLDRGEIHEHHNIGMMKGMTIEGLCFLDANCNGLYDAGESPLPGVEIRLVRQSNNVLLQTVTSDENGVYRFSGQRGSTFSVRATLPKGYAYTVLGAGEDGNRFAPNGTKIERRLDDVTVENGGYMKLMLGAVQFGAISGRVYYDSNFSSNWEQGEKISEGILVTLLNAEGEKLVTRKTDKNGGFTFNELMPGQYRLRMEPVKGYAFAALGMGNVMQLTEDGMGLSRIIQVRIGENVTGAGIAMIVPAVVTGTAFADENDNGLQDDGEKGMTGMIVRLMNDGGEVFSRTISQDGTFRFSAVHPGRYYLQYELPSNAAFAPEAKGGHAVSPDGRSEWFTVESGDTWQAPLCGGVLLSDISGIAYADSNGTGYMEEGEMPVSGMTIVLTPSRNELSAVSAVTGVDGRFAFSGLRPDTYTLTVTCPDACVLSRMHTASLGLAHGLNTQSVQLRLKMGTQWHDQQLGCVRPSNWMGFAFLDENDDGRHNANELPASGETLVLLDADTREQVAKVQTDADGRFTIEGIAPGEYELTYPLDDGNLETREGDSDFHRAEGMMTTGRVRVNENEDKAGTVLAVARTTEIAGWVWLDRYDGVTPVEQVEVHLLDAAGEQLAACKTGTDGYYVFKGLMPADYAIEVVVPAGYVLVELDDPRLFDGGLISVVSEQSGRSDVISIRMAQHRKDMDVGVVLAGRLGDKVWLDLNGNGLQDGDEGGIPNVGIELLRDEAVVAATTSDQYGYYVFESLYPADYVLRVTWPSEVVPTIHRPESWEIISVLLPDGLTVPLTVESGKAKYSADLGFVLVDDQVFPAGYGEGAVQIWKIKK